MAALDQGCNCKPWAAADQVDEGEDEVVIREGWGVVMVRRVISHGLGRVREEGSMKFEAAQHPNVPPPSVLKGNTVQNLNLLKVKLVNQELDNLIFHWKEPRGYY